MVYVIVERAFEEPATVEALQATEDAGAWCMELHQVRFIQTYFSADRKRMMCLYEAPDAEAVRRVQRQIGMPFESIWAAQFFDPYEKGVKIVD